MIKQIGRPKEETEDPVYSNIDHELDEEVVKDLKEFPNKRYAQHAAYNFCGYIWFNGEVFIEEIWVYHKKVEVLENKYILELIREANNEYGSN